MAKIYEKAKNLREGAYVLTLTKKLPINDDFEMIFQGKKQMSWAAATVNLYKKIK